MEALRIGVAAGSQLISPRRVREMGRPIPPRGAAPRRRASQLRLRLPDDPQAWRAIPPDRAVTCGARP